MKVYVDADFSGNWYCAEPHNRNNAKSRHGYIIMYNGCPVSWKSQLQTAMELLSTKSENMSLLYALMVAIQTMELLKEMKKLGFMIQSTIMKVHCKVLADKSRAL